jgi:predicted nucleotidyltransferase
MKKVTDDILNEMTCRLVAEFDPEQIFLFGSRAWGEAGDDSDVDLLVIVSQSNLKPVQRAVRAHRCLSGIAVPTDVLVKTRSEVDEYRDVYASLECEILERGRVLYENGKTTTGKELAAQVEAGSGSGA